MDNDNPGSNVKAPDGATNAGAASGGSVDDAQQAASLARDQIKRIYDQHPPNVPDGDKVPKGPPDTSEPSGEGATKHHGVYNHTHKKDFDWRLYHSAWQDYYQEYYRRYYHHLNNKKNLEQPVAKTPATGSDSEGLKALKRDIVSQVKHQAGRFRRSSHFWPLLTASLVGLTFLFVQFNSVMFAQVESYISPGALEGKSLVINNPANSTKVSPEPRLIIPKINVDMPTNFDVNTLEETKIQAALELAAVHYKLPGANAKPGQLGNTVILGHSSNDVFAQGQYKFAFVLADHLVAGDTFYVHHEGTRYTYKITDKKVIKPQEIAALQIGYDKPMLTLVTCTPAGTSINRLLIFAEQVSPDPLAATKIAEDGQDATTAAIPGNAPTLFEHLWNLFF